MTVVPSKYKRVTNDLYQTEPWVTNALLRHFPVKGLSVWDPAAGNHLMSDVIKKAGAKRVRTSDISTYDRKHDKQVSFFVDDYGARATVDAIIVNPPYGAGGHAARAWAERSLDVCPGLVALLLTMKFDSGKTRVHLFRDNPRFFAKIVLLDRISWTLDGETGTEDHAWYVWRAKPKRIPLPPMILYEEKSNGR